MFHLSKWAPGCSKSSEVSHLLAPGDWHHFHIVDWAKRFPNAVTLICPGIEAKQCLKMQEIGGGSGFRCFFVCCVFFGEVWQMMWIVVDEFDDFLGCCFVYFVLSVISLCWTTVLVG